MSSLSDCLQNIVCISIRFLLVPPLSSMSLRSFMYTLTIVATWRSSAVFSLLCPGSYNNENFIYFVHLCMASLSFLDISDLCIAFHSYNLGSKFQLFLIFMNTRLLLDFLLTSNCDACLLFTNFSIYRLFNFSI